MATLVQKEVAGGTSCIPCRFIPFRPVSFRSIPFHSPQHDVHSKQLCGCRKQIAQEFWQGRLLRQSLQQWRLSTRWSKDVGWKEDLAFQHRCTTLLTKSVDAWDVVSHHIEPLKFRTVQTLCLRLSTEHPFCRHVVQSFPAHMHSDCTMTDQHPGVIRPLACKAAAALKLFPSRAAVHAHTANPTLALMTVVTEKSFAGRPSCTTEGALASVLEPCTCLISTYGLACTGHCS